ncbi:hypothetical protein ACRB8A_19420 (plasmid) [Arthrobacter sp. G.S.26]|uniref:hypothetical protein n=1 Tax=Arthrobacter sp. G.S.26 TaxID=3433706 RepID=UPI003D76C359
MLVNALRGTAAAVKDVPRYFASCLHPPAAAASPGARSRIFYDTPVAREIGAEFIDGDSLHPAKSISKIAAGTPLTDEKRWPLLAAPAPSSRYFNL